MYLNDIAAIAIAKRIKTPEKPLAPGKYKVSGSFVVEVEAEITKSEDGFYTPTTSIPLKATLALALKKAGFMREQIISLLREAAVEALEKDEKVILAETGLESAWEMLEKELCQALPPQPRAGAVRVGPAVIVEAVRGSEVMVA